MKKAGGKKGVIPTTGVVSVVKKPVANPNQVVKVGKKVVPTVGLTKKQKLALSRGKK